MGTRSQSGARRGRQSSKPQGMFHEKCRQWHIATEPCPLDEISTLRNTLRELADAAEEMASMDQDMPSAKDTEARFDQALADARALLVYGIAGAPL